MASNDELAAAREKLNKGVKTRTGGPGGGGKSKPKLDPNMQAMLEQQRKNRPYAFADKRDEFMEVWRSLVDFHVPVPLDDPDADGDQRRQFDVSCSSMLRMHVEL